MLSSRYLKAILTISILLIASTTASAEQPTYAERLGYPVGTKAVIFHVDDTGMSHNSNMGTIKALEDGIATSFSIMMPCPWVPEITAYIKDNPTVDAGLHITLTSEWKKYRWGPVAGKSAVGGLVDSQGCLWRSGSALAANATPDEVETEIRAQLDKLRTAGIEPTHLDSHMGTCFLPQYLDRYIKIGIEEKIPVLIFGGHMQHIAAEAGPLKTMARLISKTVWNAGLPVIDDLVTSPTHAKDYDKRKAELIDLLKNMKPGITQIILHCTEVTDVFSHISGSGDARQAELQLMTDPEIKAFIEKEGIVLTSWRELKKRRQQASAAK